MKKEEFNSIYEKSLVDGNLDQDKLLNLFNSYEGKARETIETKVKTELTETLKPEIVNEFITGLNLDGVNNTDGFNAYVKNINASATEQSEQLQRLTNELNTANTTISDLNQYKEKVTVLERESLVTEKGFNPKYKRAVIAEANTLVNDDVDFASALDTVKDNYNEWLNEPKKKSAGGATPKGNPPKTDEEQVDEWRKRWVR